MRNEIEASKLTVDDRLELCKYLIKCGYAVWIETRKPAPGYKTNRTVIVYEQK